MVREAFGEDALHTIGDPAMSDAARDVMDAPGDATTDVPVPLAVHVDSLDGAQWADWTYSGPTYRDRQQYRPPKRLESALEAVHVASSANISHLGSGRGFNAGLESQSSTSIPLSPDAADPEGRAVAAEGESSRSFDALLRLCAGMTHATDFGGFLDLHLHPDTRTARFYSLERRHDHYMLSAQN
jgi:hypothetical protein